MGSPAMAHILLLSNGHGEDLSGALLAQELQKQGHSVQALPLVGLGGAYQKAGVPLLGRSHEFSTGGIGYTSLRGRLTEIVQGQVLYLLRRLMRLLRHRRRFELILVVGDVIPVMAAWLSHRPVATYLVAYSSHYEGTLRLPWPCAALLKSRRFKALFSRDHGDHIPHHQDQIKVMPVADQTHQASEQIQHLTLEDLGEATAKTGVANAAGAEFMAAP